jgi:hypothetical protein
VEKSSSFAIEITLTLRLTRGVHDSADAVGCSRLLGSVP